MLFYPENRLAIFIDGHSHQQALAHTGLTTDFVRLREFFEDSSRLLSANYYTIINADRSAQDYRRPLVDFLSYNGYVVNTKPVRFNEEGTPLQPSMAVLLTIDLLATAHRAEHLVVFSGDAELAPALEYARRVLGVRVTVVSSVESSSTAIRRAANEFVPLLDLAGEFLQDRKREGE